MPQLLVVLFVAGVNSALIFGRKFAPEVIKVFDILSEF